MFADACLKISFSFTRDSYKGFLLRHGSFSYVILTVNDREKAVCKGECEARRKSAPNKSALKKKIKIKEEA